MKKIINGGLLAIVCGAMLCMGVDAKYVYYTNDVGVEMTELQYDKMVSLYSKRYVSHMSQDEFDTFKDANIVSSGAVYYKTTYENGVVVKEEAISEEEYNSAPEGAVSDGVVSMSSDTKYVETSYKKLNAALTDYGNEYRLIGLLTWKKIPYCRSYDVFAYRLSNLSYSGFSGSQVYYVNGAHNNIAYDISSPGYKAQASGAGVSMNLVDGSNITGYELTLVTTLYGASGHVYLTYQHAQSDLTREQSLGYTLSSSGLGGVVYFSNSTIAKKYDGMSGVHLVG